MSNQTQETLEKEKRYFVRFFRFSTIGIIVTLTLSVMLYISYERWRAFTKEAQDIQLQYDQSERQAIKGRIDQIEQFLHYQINNLTTQARERLKSSVSNVRSALNHGFQKQQNRLSGREYVALVKDDYRELDQLNLADIDHDNFIFIIGLDGTSILEPNMPELEGENLLEHPRYQSMFKGYLEILQTHPEGGYANSYLSPSDGHDAIAFITADRELGVVIGTHVDRHDILHLAKHSLVTGLRDIFSLYDDQLIAADTSTMKLLQHADSEMIGRDIVDFPELLDSFRAIMQKLRHGNHYGKVTCIRDLKTRELGEKTVYVKQFPEIGIIVSTGFFESDYNLLVEEKIAKTKTSMFNEMLLAIAVVFIFGALTALASLLFRQKISRSFDYFGSEIEAYQNELTRSLTTDALTGLRNRNSLIQQLKEHNNIALAIINIDGFNEINDFYGTDTGDKVLQFIAARLRHTFKEPAYLSYRLHADEFAIVEFNTDSLDTLMPRIEALIAEFHSSIEEIDDFPISVHLSAGLSDDYVKPLLYADIALKTARKKNLPCIAYEDTIDAKERYQKNLYWTNKVKWAIENDRFVPYYQPIYDLHKGIIEKYECLVRILDRDETVLSPLLFLEMAHRSRLYSNITRIMIEKSFRHFAGTPYSFSINISISDILDSETVRILTEKIREYDVGRQLILEIIETEELEHNPTIETFFKTVHRLGCKIAIDDFGTGYSNFSYLQTLKPDFVKIDGSLIRHIDTDANARSIVEVIVQYAKRNGIKTIGEYVTSHAVLQRATALGIDFAQGYYICEPKPDISDVPSLLRLKKSIAFTPVTAPLAL